MDKFFAWCKCVMHAHYDWDILRQDNAITVAKCRHCNNVFVVPTRILEVLNIPETV